MAVTVLLPVYRAKRDELERSFDDICCQTCEDLEILVILNGSDASTHEAATALCAREPRGRVIELNQANLAAALNAGMQEARFELIARMDADDRCEPHRIAQQVAAMESRPEVLALGSAYEIADRQGRRVGVVTPPSDGAESRWKLLVSNPFAHGSMMLRRSAVLAAGGYDASFVRSQDYDLWVRLSEIGEVCALPQVLYTLTRSDRAFGATPEQGEHAARVMARAWAGLARGDLDEAAAGRMIERQSVAGVIATLEDRMSERGPTLTDVAAWLFGQWASPGSHVKAFDVARGARLREVGRAMQDAGVTRVWLWGAGRHTGWLLDHVDDLGVPVAGIVDDALAGQERFGRVIESPQAMRGGEHVLLSSDWHEDAMWASSAEARGRGVRVWRMYADEPVQQRTQVA